MINCNLIGLTVGVDQGVVLPYMYIQYLKSCDHVTRGVTRVLTQSWRLFSVVTGRQMISKRSQTKL